MTPWVAGPDEAPIVATLLHDFNTEFDTPTPGVEALVPRLETLLASEDTFAVLGGEPAVAVGLVTLRPNVWYEGRVALLDELYVVPARRGGGIGSAVLDLVVTTAAERGAEVVEINVDESDVDAQRFYARHGFTMTDPDTGERAFYLYRELDG